MDNQVKIKHYIFVFLLCICLIFIMRACNNNITKNNKIRQQKMIENMEINPLLLDDGCYKVCE